MSHPSDLFGKIARRAIADGAFPGAIFRVEDREGLLFEECWGDALCTDSARIPLSTSTIFDLASLSKLFTTTAVLRLASLGKLALNDTVSGLYRRCLFSGCGVDESILARFDDILGTINVADLLSHASGIHYWYPFYTEHNRSFESILADLLEAYPPP